MATLAAASTLSLSAVHGSTVIANLNTASGATLTDTATEGYTVSALTATGFDNLRSGWGQSQFQTAAGAVASSHWLGVRNDAMSATANYTSNYLSFSISGITEDIVLNQFSFDLGLRSNGGGYIGIWASIDGGNSWTKITLSGFSVVGYVGTVESAGGGTAAGYERNNAYAEVIDYNLTTGYFSIDPLGYFSDTYAGNVTADLTGLGTIEAGSTIEFRIGLGSPGNGTSGQYPGMYFQNFQVTATPIPEPSTYALGAAGVLAGLIFIRRRRK